MKKISKIILGASLFFSVIFTGCFDPVYWGVMKDVAPEDPTVSGTIPAITRYTVGSEEFLAVNADGGLRYKNVNSKRHGAWRTFGNLPFSLVHFNYYGGNDYEGEQIIKVVANSTYIYLVTAFYEKTTEGNSRPSAIKLWAAQMKLATGSTDVWELNGTWTNVITDAYGSRDYFPVYEYANGTEHRSAFNVFQTNDITATNRHVYIRTGSTDSYAKSAGISEPKYYEVTGTTAPTTPLTIGNYISSTDINTPYPTGGVDINNAIYFGGVKFLTTNGAVTNGTELYFGSGSTLIYYDGTTLSSTVNAQGVISALVLCSDAILIGEGSDSGSGGIQRCILDTTTNPGKSRPSAIRYFETNADSQITKHYQVNSMISTDVSPLSETSSTIYAAIDFPGTSQNASASYSTIGLWSYYPNRGNWNRE